MCVLMDLRTCDMMHCVVCSILYATKYSIDVVCKREMKCTAKSDDIW